MSSSEPGPQYEKVLEIGPIPPPRAGWGVRIEFVLNAMRARGIDCAALDVGPNRRVRRAGVEDVQSGWDYARKVWRYLARGYRIHTHLNANSAMGYVLVLYATVLSRLFARPVVLTWHGGLAQRWFPRANGSRLANAANRTIFRLSETIICNDELVKREIVDYGIPESKVIPIPAFSEEYVRFTPVELPSRILEFLSRHRPLAFCYTLFEPGFYIPELISAVGRIVERHPGLGVVLVGNARGSEAAVAQIGRLGLEQSVCICGDLSHDEFMTLLNKSDLCIRTPQRDGVCSSVLQALAIGVPVVAAANPLRPAQVHTYPAGDPEALSEAVCRVLAMSPDERRPAPPRIPSTVGREVAVLTGECCAIGQETNETDGSRQPSQPLPETSPVNAG